MFHHNSLRNSLLFATIHNTYLLMSWIVNTPEILSFVPSSCIQKVNWWNCSLSEPLMTSICICMKCASVLTCIHAIQSIAFEKITFLFFHFWSTEMNEIRSTHQWIRIRWKHHYPWNMTDAQCIQEVVISSAKIHLYEYEYMKDCAVREHYSFPLSKTKL